MSESLGRFRSATRPARPVVFYFGLLGLLFNATYLVQLARFRVLTMAGSWIGFVWQKRALEPLLVV
jgi:hypothetical protein